MARQLVISWKATPAAALVYYLVPSGASVLPGQYVNPVRQGWPLYTGVIGNLSVDCGIAVPDTDGPTWGTVSPPAYLAGQYYEWIVPPASASPFAGQSIAGYGASVLPGYLRAVNTLAGLKIYTATVIPTGTTGAISITLYAEQGNARRTNRVIALPETVANAEIYAHVRYEPGIGFRVRLGGDAGASLPKVKIIAAPTGWTDTEQRTFRAFGADADGRSYPYEYAGYGPGPNGNYTFEFFHFGRLKYGTYVVTGALAQSPLTLTDAYTPGTQAIPLFQIDPTRLSSARVALLKIYATSAVRIRLTGPSYDSGAQSAGVVGPVGSNQTEYQYSSAVLAAGSYTARVELIENPDIFQTLTFTVASAPAPTLTYTLLDLWEGTPIASVSVVNRVWLKRLNRNGNNDKRFELYADGTGLMELRTPQESGAVYSGTIESSTTAPGSSTAGFSYLRPESLGASLTLEVRVKNQDTSKVTINLLSSFDSSYPLNTWVQIYPVFN